MIRSVYKRIVSTLLAASLLFGMVPEVLADPGEDTPVPYRGEVYINCSDTENDSCIYTAEAWLYDAEWGQIEGYEPDFLWLYDCTPGGDGYDSEDGSRTLVPVGGFSEALLEAIGTDYPDFSWDLTDYEQAGNLSGYAGLFEDTDLIPAGLWTSAGTLPQISPEEIVLPGEEPFAGAEAPASASGSGEYPTRYANEFNGIRLYCVARWNLGGSRFYAATTWGQEVNLGFYVKEPEERASIDIGDRVADPSCGTDATFDFSYELDYAGTEVSYQWYRSAGRSYTGTALEGENQSYFYHTYPSLGLVEYYYCTAVYVDAHGETVTRNSPIGSASRSDASGVEVEIYPMPLFGGDLTGSGVYGAGIHSEPCRGRVTKVEAYSNERGSSNLFLSLGDEAYASAYLEPAHYAGSIACSDRLYWSWYRSSDAACGEDRVLLDSGEVTGVSDYGRGGSAGDLEALNLYVNASVLLPSDEAGSWYLTLEMTNEYKGSRNTVRKTSLVTVYESADSLYEIGRDGELLAYFGAAHEITVPGTVDGITVLSTGSVFGEEWSPLVSIRSIVLPDSVAVIPEASFSNCVSLESVTFGSGLCSIGSDAFYNCVSLESVTLGGELGFIGRWAFCRAGCRSVSLPADVFPEIGDYAFSSMPRLESVVLPANARGELGGEGVFAGCGRLTRVLNAQNVLNLNASDDFRNTPMTEVLDGNYPSDGSFYYKPLTDSSDSVIGCSVFSPVNLELTDAVIPGSCGDLPVLGIGEGSFSGFTGLETVTIPDSVTFIGDYAFSGCTALESLAMPAGLEEIGESAFSGCSALTSANFSELTGLEAIGNSAFSDCCLLASPVTLPYGVRIGMNAFLRCYSIPSCSVSGAKIMTGAFDYCYNLAEITGSWSKAVQPESPNGDNYTSFLYCAALPVNYTTFWISQDPITGEISETVDEEKSKYYRCGSNAVQFVLQSQSSYAGYWGYTYVCWCDPFTEEVVYPGTETIDGRTVTVLNVSDKLKNTFASELHLTVGEGVECVKTALRYAGAPVTSVSLPSTLKSFGTSFQYCDRLAGIEIPAGVTGIEFEAFKGCSALADVTFTEGGSADLTIGSSAFQDRTLIREIELPLRTVRVGECAFQGCSALTRVSLPEGLEEISSGAFRDCPLLQVASFPSTLKTLGRYAFAGSAVAAADLTPCTALTAIPNSAFADCAGLETVLLGDGILSIGEYAFSKSGDAEGYRPISDFRMPRNLTEIGYRAFYGAFLNDESTEPTLLTIPATVTAIGGEAFSAGTPPEGRYQSIDFAGGCLPAGLTSLGAEAFSGTALSFAVIPAGMTKIPAGAFCGAGRLTAVTLHDGITEIRRDAFRDTALSGNLGVMTLPASLTSIGESAFRGNPGISEFIVPAGIREIGWGAFACSNFTSLSFAGKRIVTILCPDAMAPYFPYSLGESSDCPILVRCHEGSSAYNWARSAGEYVSCSLISNGSMLRASIIRENGGVLGTGELKSVSWYDETLGDGVCLSSATTLEDADPEHLYRCRLVFTDEFRCWYKVLPEMSLYFNPSRQTEQTGEPSRQTEQTYVAEARELLTVSGSLPQHRGYALHAEITVSFGSYSREWPVHITEDGSFSVEGIPASSVTFSAHGSGYLPLRMREIQLSASDGSVELGTLMLTDNNVNRDWDIRYVHEDGLGEHSVDPSEIRFRYSLENLGSDENPKNETLNGFSVDWSGLHLGPDADTFVAIGDRLRLSCSAFSSASWLPVEPVEFVVDRESLTAPELTVRLLGKGSLMVLGDRMSVFDADGNYLNSSWEQELVEGNYTVLVYSEIYPYVTDVDYFSQGSYPDGSWSQFSVSVYAGQTTRVIGEVVTPDRTEFLKNTDFASRYDYTSVLLQNGTEYVPLVFNFSFRGPYAGAEKKIVFTDYSLTEDCFLRTADGSCAWLKGADGKPLSFEAEIKPGNASEFFRIQNHTVGDSLTVTTRADEGTVWVYVARKGQNIGIGYTADGIGFGAAMSTYVDVPEFTFTAPAETTGWTDLLLPVSSMYNEPTIARVYVDGVLSGETELEARSRFTSFQSMDLSPATAFVPFHIDPKGCSEAAFTVYAEIVSAQSGELLAVSDSWRILYTEECQPRTLNMTVRIDSKNLLSHSSFTVDYVRGTSVSSCSMAASSALGEGGRLIHPFTFDFSVEMENANRLKVGSASVLVYLGSSLPEDEQTCITVPLTESGSREKEDGSGSIATFKGTLEIPGGTLTVQSFPLRFEVDCETVNTAGTGELNLTEDYFQELADSVGSRTKNAGRFSGTLTRSSNPDEEAEDYYTMDASDRLDMETVSLILDFFRSDGVSAENRLTEAEAAALREYVIGYNELCELQAASGSAADIFGFNGMNNGTGAAFGLLQSCGMTCSSDSSTAEELLEEGAVSVDTDEGTFYIRYEGDRVSVYDPEDGLVWNADPSSAGEDPSPVLQLLSDTSGSATGNKGLTRELADFAARYQSVCGWLDAIKKAAFVVVESEEGFLQKYRAIQTIEADIAFDKVMKEHDVLSGTIAARIADGSANPAQLEAMKKINQGYLDKAYDYAAKSEKYAALYESKLSRITQMKDYIVELWTIFTSTTRPGKALAGPIRRITGICSDMKTLLGDVVPLVSVVIETAALLSKYCELEERLDNIVMEYQLGTDDFLLLQKAAYHDGGYEMIQSVLDAHGLDEAGQLIKGRNCAHELLEDLEDETHWLNARFGCACVSAAANVVTSLMNLFPAAKKAALCADICVFTASNVSELVTTIGVEQNNLAVDEEWEDVVEHCVKPVGKNEETERPKRRATESTAAYCRLVVDPSGYAYEAVESNRLSDVEMKVFYRDAAGGEVLWDASEYEQENPILTDESGAYAWFTPTGRWKVRASKEGYLPASSEDDPASEDGWLPILPPQLNVNIPMVSTQAPTVLGAEAGGDRLRLTFSQYMDLDQAENGGLFTLTVDGQPVSFTIESPDREESPLKTGVFYGRIIDLLLPEGTAAGSVSVTVDGSLKNYAGKALGSDYQSGPVTVKQIPERIDCSREDGILTLRVLDTTGTPIPNAEIIVEMDCGGIISLSEKADDPSRLAVKRSTESRPAQDTGKMLLLNTGADGVLELEVSPLGMAGTEYLTFRSGELTAEGAIPVENGIVALPGAVREAACYASLTLNDEIAINLSLKDLGASFDLEKLELIVDGRTLSPADGTPGDGTLKCVLARIPASGIRKQVHVEIRYDRVLVKEFDYSVSDYCVAVREIYGNASPIGALCGAVLNYGVWAQNYLTGESAGAAEDWAVDPDGVVMPDPVTSCVKDNDKVTGASAALALGSRVSLVYSLSTELELEKDDFILRNNLGQLVRPENVTVTAKDGGYEIRVGNIGASKLSRSYTLTIRSVPENEFHVTYGVYSYCADVQNREGGQYTDSLKKLCRIICLYGEAARAYAESRNG